MDAGVILLRWGERLALFVPFQLECSYPSDTFALQVVMDIYSYTSDDILSKRGLCRIVAVYASINIDPWR